jgi:hypothetical protein
MMSYLSPMLLLPQPYPISHATARAHRVAKQSRIITADLKTDEPATIRIETPS